MKSLLRHERITQLYSVNKSLYKSNSCIAYTKVTPLWLWNVTWSKMHYNFSCFLYRQLLFCRVILGRAFLQFSAMKMAHAPPGHHAVIGRPSVGGLAFAEYVIYRGEQVRYHFSATILIKLHANLVLNQISVRWQNLVSQKSEMFRRGKKKWHLRRWRDKTLYLKNVKCSGEGINSTT